MRAVLSFEAESMAEASTRVSAAASAAGTDQARSQRNHQSFRSEIYEPGTGRIYLQYLHCKITD
jgi:hypothetical protein